MKLEVLGWCLVDLMVVDLGFGERDIKLFYFFPRVSPQIVFQFFFSHFVVVSNF